MVLPPRRWEQVLALLKEKDRLKLVELMEGVEDIPAPVMHEGLEWQWETFDEYLSALNKKSRYRYLRFVTSCSLRVYVMGDRAINHEKATIEDMKKMRELTKQAVRAGAFGFSTSRTISHKFERRVYTYFEST